VTVDQASGAGETTLYFRNETVKGVPMALIGAIETPVNSPVLIEFSTDTTTSPTVVYERTVPPRTTISVRLLITLCIY
jgi:hypothetical protein